MPHVPDETGRCDIPLLVEVERPQHGVEMLAAQYLDDCAQLQRSGFLDRLRPDLYRGVGVERVPFGLVAPGAKRVHGACCLCIPAGVGKERH